LKLYEYEAKDILKKKGIPTPEGFLAASSQQARDAAAKIAKPVVVKAQVLLSGRGKAGGILFASSMIEAEKAAEELLNTEIKGTPVKMILVEEKIPISKELYFGVTVDRLNRSYVLISSSIGGMEIEEVAAQSPKKVLRTMIDPWRGFRSFHARKIAKEMGYNGKQELELAQILETMYRVAMEHDSLIFEINPLAETIEGKFVAADARIIIDDNALFRHPEYEKTMLEENREQTPQEKQALKSKVDYVKLEGNIGIVGNGAGLVMATLDMINYYGGKPANFLDLGGGAAVERIASALKILFSDQDVDVMFVNILGGITQCDEVANAIVETLKSTCWKKAMIIRIAGTNEEEGKRILRNAGFTVLESMEEAAKKAVEIAKKEVKPAWA
jgi:succinyl-CoA synthetase beta subunit